MISRNLLLATALGAWATQAAACASERRQDPPSAQRLSRGDASAGSGAEACLALSEKVWDRDVIESLRYLRRGAELRDADCCRRYLAHAEAESVNLSQRTYARLFVEGVLREGPVRTRSGEDVRGELYYQLCWAWRYTKPVCLPKVRQLLREMVETGATPPAATAAFMAQMDTDGTRGEVRQEIQLYAAESADEARPWLRVPITPGHPEAGDWSVADVNVWGGGSDRLLLATNVLAFLVNSSGEPSFRGNRLWVCNLGSGPVFLSSLAVGWSNRELPPGRPELLSLMSAGTEKSAQTTGIPISVRYRRGLR